MHTGGGGRVWKNRPFSQISDHRDLDLTLDRRAVGYHSIIYKANSIEIGKALLVQTDAETDFIR